MKYKYMLFSLLLCFINIISIKAISVEYVDNIYGNRLNGSTNYSGKLGFIVDDNNVLYCVEPFKWIGDNYNIDNNYLNNIESNKLKYVEMIANYVKDYVRNRNVNYYISAQELIWNTLTDLDTFYWTSEKNLNGNLINNSLFKEEIKSFVNNFFLKPSFDNTVISDNFFKTIVLEDFNGVISNYEVQNNSKNKVWIKDNKLYITILQSDDAKIKLIRKYGEGSPRYYHSEIKQDIVDLTGYVENISYITIRANDSYHEPIKVEFIDKDTNLLVNGNIEFKLNNDYLSTTNGIYLTDLNQGKYSIDVVGVPKNYILPDKVQFNIDEMNQLSTRSVKVYLTKPTGVLNISASTGKYELHNQSGLISKFTDSTSFELNLDTYYVIDIIEGKKYDVNIEYVDQYTKIITYDLTIKKEQYEKSTIIPSSYELPNTINYIKLLKICLIIILGILILKHLYEIFKK